MPSREVPRTWDGLEIALDDPPGCAVVVRRLGPAGHPEFLLLHRNAEGADYEGDWAWTSPAGCRQPGEAVYPSALRELAEEAGITGRLPWAVDMGRRSGGGGSWAVFALDVQGDTEVELVDPEHDRYEWLSAEQAMRRVRPSFVAQAQIERVSHIGLAAPRFRPMAETDFADVARWRTAPHVREWFHGELIDEATVAARFAPRLAGDVPTRMWVVDIGDAAVGYLQDYRVSDHPDAVKTRDMEAVGFDYLIGAPDLVGKGLGTRMVWEFCRDVLARDHPDAPRFIACPSHRNGRSRRVLAKCGFSEGLWIDEPAAPGRVPDTEVVCTLDVRHWFG